MSLYEHIDEFYGLRIEAFDHKKDIQDGVLALRVEVDYDEAEDGLTMLSVLTALANDAKAGQIQALIVGVWEEAYEESAQPFIDLLIENKDKFKNLKALFFGEMTSEENEISWIQQGDYSKFWVAYPDVQHLQIRGAEGLSLGEIKNNGLTKLIIETGGLSAAVLNQVSDSNLPALEHLELWLGDENYGWDGTIDSVKPLLSSEKFPKLKHLAIKNSEIEDEIAQQVAASKLLNQLQVLDLSMGLMTDNGAELLLAAKENMGSLKLLDVSENFLSDEMVNKISTLPMTVKADEQKEAEDDGDGDVYRYVSVSE